MTERIQFAADGVAAWAGMNDYLLVSPDGRHTIESQYVSEPPHGDSYHRLKIDGRAFPGYASGNFFGFSPCSRYAVFSWMAKLFDRHTVVVDLQAQAYFALPGYIHEFRVRWPTLEGVGQRCAGERYTFNGAEVWQRY